MVGPRQPAAQDWSPRTVKPSEQAAWDESLQMAGSHGRAHGTGCRGGGVGAGKPRAERTGLGAEVVTCVRESRKPSTRDEVLRRVSLKPGAWDGVPPW